MCDDCDAGGDVVVGGGDNINIHKGVDLVASIIYSSSSFTQTHHRYDHRVNASNRRYCWRLRLQMRNVASNASCPSSSSPKQENGTLSLALSRSLTQLCWMINTSAAPSTRLTSGDKRSEEYPLSTLLRLYCDHGDGNTSPNIELIIIALIKYFPGGESKQIRASVSCAHPKTTPLWLLLSSPLSLKSAQLTPFWWSALETSKMSTRSIRKGLFQQQKIQKKSIEWFCFCSCSRYQ